MLYEDDPDQDIEVGNQKCTPETLLVFIRESIRKHNRWPTLLECKAEFGGILSAMICGHQLEAQGLPADLAAAKKRKSR